MADKTTISWCDSTFNPWIGCTKVGPGCDHCYAEADFDHRKHRATWGPGQPRSRTSAANWKKPLQWNSKPFYECPSCGYRGDKRELGHVCTRCGAVMGMAHRRVFCASLGDVFDNEVPRQWRQDLFDLILATPNLDWMLLTKRIGNARKMLNEVAVCRGALLTANDEYRPPENLWIGATICTKDETDRDVQKLLAVPAAVRFLSMEPLLEHVGLSPFIGLTRDGNRWARRADLRGIRPGLHWVIAGGESGYKARSMDLAWLRELRDQCSVALVPFFMKQLSQADYPATFGDVETFPPDLQVREFPEVRHA